MGGRQAKSHTTIPNAGRRLGHSGQMDRGESEPDTVPQFVALAGMDSGLGGPDDAAAGVHSSLIANNAM
jgi:hypothetical protein